MKEIDNFVNTFCWVFSEWPSREDIGFGFMNRISNNMKSFSMEKKLHGKRLKRTKKQFFFILFFSFCGILGRP